MQTIAPFGLRAIALKNSTGWAMLALLVAGAAAAQTPQGPKQQACINAMNGKLQQVAKAAARNATDCIKAATKDSLPPGIATVDDCVAMDPKGKVQKVQAKTPSTEERSCRVPPDFGKTDVTTVNDAGRGQAEALFEGIFGPDMDANIASDSSMRNTAVCQRDIASLVGKCLATRLKVYNSCKKLALADRGNPPLAQSAPGLAAACLTQNGDLATGQPDPSGAIEKLCNSPIQLSRASDLLGRKMARICSGQLPSVSPLGSFPGCGSTGYTEVHRCLQHKAACHACLAIIQADALIRDCDLFDNGSADGSCP